MARVTNKLADQNLKDIAIDKYEKKKISRIPTEIVDLVSQGKVYPKSHPLSSGELEMRYMTAYDEDILTNLSYIREGVMIDKLIESISLTKFNISELSLYDKEALLIHIRISKLLRIC